ncbi:MAG: TonB-dependent receptor plug domain-containing protein [Chitinophagales bacterium]
MLTISIVTAQEEWHYLDMVEISDTKKLQRKRDTVITHSTDIGALSQSLQRENGVYIRNYGPSNIASLSVRGTEPAQNQVLYRDLNLNSMFLGQTDLSLFNTSAGDFSLTKGISSLSKNSGALGGLLSFDFNPVFSSARNHGLDLALEGGSFHTYRMMAQSRFSSENLFSTTKLSYDRSRNNYKYRDIGQAGNPWVNQENAAFQRLNFNHNVAKKINNRQALEWGAAYFFMDRQVPPAILSSNQSESQEDHLGVLNLQYKLSRSKHALRLAGYYKFQYLEYQNLQAEINSQTTAHTSMMLAEHKFAIRPQMILKSRLENQTDWVNNENIGSVKSRNRTVLSTVLNHNLNNYFSWSGNLRQDFYSDFVSPFLFHFGFKVFPLGKEKFYIGADGGRNFRYPTINDLYWQPGGNLDIEAESSWGGELSSNYNLKKNKWQFNFSQQLYLYRIKNQIRWLPSSEGFWQAQNIDNVLSWGYEPQVTFAFSPDQEWKLEAQIFYHLNNSFESAERWQSIYVPKHQVKSILFLSYKGFFAEYSQEWSSERYTSRDNSTFLEPYMLYNLSLGKDFNFKKHLLRLQLRMENLSNESYVLMAGRPMPGRAFYGTLRYRWR